MNNIDTLPTQSTANSSSIEMKTTEINCLCGAVKVQLTGEPMVQFYCHCDDCQATSGGAYVSAAIFPLDAVTVTQGELTTWTLKTLPRQRCPICGTHMLVDVTDIPAYGVIAYSHDFGRRSHLTSASKSYSTSAG